MTTESGFPTGTPIQVVRYCPYLKTTVTRVAHSYPLLGFYVSHNFSVAADWDIVIRRTTYMVVTVSDLSMPVWGAAPW
jgi:hypothetical protein